VSTDSLAIDFNIWKQHTDELNAFAEFIITISALTPPVDRKLIRERCFDRLSGLLENSSYSDFTIVVNEKEFKVHRNILAASSKVFKSMFDSNMKESTEGRCEVDHIEPIVFDYLLRFIYGGQLPDDLSGIAISLYEAANYYDLNDLKEICKEQAYSKLTAENAFEAYKWAHLYNITELKAKSWIIVKRDVLKITNPLKKEPLSPQEIEEIIDHQTKEATFWSKFNAD